MNEVIHSSNDSHTFAIDRCLKRRAVVVSWRFVVELGIGDGMETLDDVNHLELSVDDWRMAWMAIWERDPRRVYLATSPICSIVSNGLAVLDMRRK